MLNAALVLAIAGVTASALLGEHGIMHLRRLRAERTELRRTAFTLLETNARLRHEIEQLKSDDRYLEELARRQLGLVRPNEFIYKSPSPHPSR